MIVTVPLVNTNEQSATVVELRAAVGQRVAVGDVLCVLETTKSVVDVNAEADGYIHGWKVRRGMVVEVGQELCRIESMPVPTEGEVESPVPNVTAPAALPAGLRITKPAQRLALELGVALEQLPRDSIVTEGIVRTFSQSAAKTSTHAQPTLGAGGAEVLIYGGRGHCRAIIDLLRQSHQFRIAGFVDDTPTAPREIFGVPLLGTRDQLGTLYEGGLRLAINAVGALSRIQSRIDIFELLQAQGFSFPVVIHPRAVIEPSAALAPGSQVFALAYVGSAAVVGMGAIINTGALVSHDCEIGEYAHIAPGAILAGGVRVGSATLIGMGATVSDKIRIGARVQIGNGAQIHGNVPDRTIVRAGTSYPPTGS